MTDTYTEGDWVIASYHGALLDARVLEIWRNDGEVLFKMHFPALRSDHAILPAEVARRLRDYEMDPKVARRRRLAQLAAAINTAKAIVKMGAPHG